MAYSLFFQIQCQYSLTKQEDFFASFTTLEKKLLLAVSNSLSYYTDTLWYLFFTIRSTTPTGTIAIPVTSKKGDPAQPATDHFKGTKLFQKEIPKKNGNHTEY